MAIRVFPATCKPRHYRLTEDNRIAIEYRATVDKPCPVNLTNHVYFNLDGGQTDVRNHQLQTFADSYLPVESDGIPGGDLQDVARPASIFAAENRRGRFPSRCRSAEGERVRSCFPAAGKRRCPQGAAHVWSQDGQLQMTVYTSAPALQFIRVTTGGTPSHGTAVRRLARSGAGERISAGFTKSSGMAAAGLHLAPGRGTSA
jgi:aldose 1-epimerase